MRSTTSRATPRGRTGAAAVLGLTAATALSACSTPAAADVPGVTDDTVVIGTHQPLTGPAAAGFASISAATAAYFEYVNDRGGINGRQIEYVVKDDGYNPATTQTVVRELVQQEEVFAIVNGLGTPTHSGVLDYLDQNGVPDLFVASGSLTWDQPEEYPNTFGFNADYVTEGAALAQYALDTDPDAVVCVLGQDDDFGEGILQGVELVADEVAVNETYSTADQDVTAQLGAMKEAGCTHNVLGTINGFTALAVGTAAQMGWFPAWHVSSSGADHPTLVEYLGEDGAPALEGLVSVNYLPHSPSSDWYELFTRINDEYNDGAPYTGNTTYGMSVGYQFAEALAAAGQDPTRESIVAALESGELRGNGVAPLTYSADDHFAYRTVRVAVVSDGVQDFVDAAYEVSESGATAVTPQETPLENEGVPAG
ncbi:ABC transporter substrate-binding protein [Promicromonospora citrea]|uniref:ABC transporter substrate-binding protein n=1 Tax=Promicromonospora citrea TaxID=43677 RepID=A0A8H9GKL8_9MICO|nr:ABC transporter substrate-binding protein [Promicromonospora citrea]NNH53245.1 ABC transporter substrate-binding protein [Promicromonospora citrea]GGM34832.1 ABC transporter substrate-binding protein [Promicromonospora citrea]HEV6951616.1 ABC transporter substrate-binding protein [Promicromonospora sp.]